MKSNWDRSKCCSKRPCLINPLYFEKKESVNLCAKKVFKYFEDNPCADFKDFHEWTLNYSKVYSETPNRMQLTVLEQILEFAGFVPHVCARLLSDIKTARESGAGEKTIAKSLNIPLGLVRKILFEDSPVFLSADLFFEFQEKYLKSKTPSFRELINALIRHRKDYNRFVMDQILQEYEDKKGSNPSVVKLYDIYKQKTDRRLKLKNSWIDWDGDIDVYEELSGAKEVKEIRAFKTSVHQMKANKEIAYIECDEEYDENAYDKKLEAQVITPPAWYIEKVWGENKLPGIHLPLEMWNRYLSIYEKKLSRGIPATPRSY